MRKMLSILITLFISLMVTTGFAEGNTDRGAMLANTCLGCHGIDGYRNAYPSYRVPKLGGQHEEYIVVALKGYKNKARSHPTMLAQAGSMSDSDIRAVAVYFAAEGSLEEGSANSGAAISRGEEKAVVCTACHGATGVSTMPNWPILAGQHTDYLVQAMGQYQNGERSDPVMVGQAAALSEQDIKDLAAYYAAQPGLFTSSD